MNDDSASSTGGGPPPGRAASDAPLTQPPESTPARATESVPRPGPGTTRAAPAGPPKAGTWRYTFMSLSNPDFRFLWFGLLLLMGGMQMQMIARGYLTYDLTSSPLLLGLVNAGFALPMLGLALFGGAIADRMNRKRVIQLGQAGAAAIGLFIAVSISAGVVTWYHLLAASMFQGVVFSFLMPARQAIIPQLVGQDNLTNAMALNAAAMSVTTLIAPTVAGTLYGWIGPAGVYYLIVGFSVGSVVLTGMIKNVDGGRAGPAAPMLSDIKDGNTRMGAIAEGTGVKIIIGKAEITMSYDDAFAFAQFVRIAGREAKRNNGDMTKQYRIAGKLTDAATGKGIGYVGRG